MLAFLSVVASIVGCSEGSGGGLPPANAVPAAALKPPGAADCSVTLYGDSILYGTYGTTPTNRLVDPPAAAIKRLRPAYTVVDRTSPGDFVNLRLPTFRREAIETRFVVIEHGMNDAGNRFDYAEPLRSMIRGVKAMGKTPIVTGLSRPRSGEVSTRDAYDAIARSVAAEERVIFADWGAVPMTDADLQDELHPGQDYSHRLAEQLVSALDRAAPECR
ncbi:SGNH/GDSL hydrolase family protein [Variovorax sp. WDL1]|uniref:SGNH/GDSL hydrolase family protein n=1 Tax=Variovorax sp. WDL1 TaxID=207745 RepID=UPI001E5EAEBF|nr:SGNH/GDSL hydrolase family protein [Variovorax sp. WDL1]